MPFLALTSWSADSQVFDLRFFDDLYSFDLVNMTWTDLSAAEGSFRPSARSQHGFTSRGEKLYVHGGGGGKFDLDSLLI